jgi:hypothetical protein
MLENQWTKMLTEKQETIDELRRETQRLNNRISEMRVAMNERDKLTACLMRDLATEKKLTKHWEEKARQQELPM